jgi:transposase
MNYDHYIALDWAQRNMAVGRMTKNSEQPKITEAKSDIEDLKIYLRSLKGSKILTFEESNPAHWLFTELKSEVDEIIVCDPYRNYLLKEGHKSDPIDAGKLCMLLKGNLLKPVFHCTDEFINLRKLVSGYEDLIHAVVQLKNRISAMYRAKNLEKGDAFNTPEENFVMQGLNRALQLHEEQRLLYEAEFRKVRKRHKVVRDLESIPGIGLINAVKLVAIVVDARRFTNKSPFLVYCGLLRTEATSGGRSYGRRSPRHSRQLKCVFRTAALACMNTKADHPLKDYYNAQIKKGLPEYVARHALSRRIAVLTLGVMKSGKKLNQENLCKNQNDTIAS